MKTGANIINDLVCISSSVVSLSLFLSTYPSLGQEEASEEGERRERKFISIFFARSNVDLKSPVPLATIVVSGR